MAVRCFQVCQEDRNLPRLLLRSFCVADKVAVFSSVRVQFLAAFKGFSRWVPVSLLISRCRSYPRHSALTGSNFRAVLDASA